LEKASNQVLSFLNKYAKDCFSSQNGEEGVLLEVLERLSFHVNKGHAVEAGGHDGMFCSNTALLLKSYGWSGLFVEGQYDLYLKCKENWKDNPRVRCQCCYVDGNNINAFVDDDCDLLSLDTDGSDYEIFCGMKARPKIVIVEVDSSIEPPSERFNADGAAGYWSMTVAALERGYFVLCHTGNLVLVQQEYAHLFPECAPHPLLEWELYFNRGWVKESAA
jgi:hypothetical protein